MKPSPLICVFCVAATAAAVDLKSPNGKIGISVEPSADGLVYSVLFEGKPIIEPSRIAFSLDGKEISQRLKTASVKLSETSETYPWRGNHTVATNRSKNLTMSFDGGTPGVVLELRAFDDGVAFRHKFASSAEARVPDESTQFTLPAGSVVWHHGLGGHYEDVYAQSAVAEIKSGEWIAPPLTLRLANGGGYAVITEAALANYSGMALEAAGERKFTIGLGHKHPISYPFRLRYSNQIDRVSVPATIAGEIVSPWRVIMISADLNGLVNSDIVPNLCPPPDPKLFPRGLDTSWVKPGRAVWKYLDGGANTFDDMKRFSAWAGELGFEYNVLEGFWSRWPEAQLKELVEFSRQRGVGLWLWRHSRELRTPEAREAFFTRLANAGAVGAKIDFFDHEHREVIDLYQTLLADAARHKIMVNFHGANKPTGEARTFPNEMIREGVRGMESSRLKERAVHNTILPFTRFLVGPADYTPVHFGARRGDTTFAHQVATAAVFTEPLLTYGAHPTNLLESPALPFIKAIPATWDETRALPVSRIGELAAFARRSGETWFLAVLNGPKETQVKIPLNFLEKKKFTAHELRDGAAPTDLRLTNGVYTTLNSIDLKLEPGGGFLARFAP